MCLLLFFNLLVSLRVCAAANGVFDLAPQQIVVCTWWHAVEHRNKKRTPEQEGRWRIQVHRHRSAGKPRPIRSINRHSKGRERKEKEGGKGQSCQGV
uniref:Putative secreted protein n=1 Tax=Anopheles darlingi TaxID=43151 RepID=A0A2M4D158_ANODA